MDNKKIAQGEIYKSQKIIDQINSKPASSWTPEEFWKIRTATANKMAFEEYLKGGVRKLPQSLYNLDYKKMFIQSAFNPFELESLLNQLKDPKTGKVASEGDIRAAINSLIRTKKGSLNEISKAMATDDLLDQLLAHITHKEMSPILGNDFDNTPENLRKIREHQIPGISEAKKAIGLGDGLTFELPPVPASGIYNHSMGYINLNPYFAPDYPDTAFKKAMRRAGLGAFFHEGSHDIDELNQRIAILRKELEKKNNPLSLDFYGENRGNANKMRQYVQDPQYKKLVENVLGRIEKFEKENPGKVDTDEDILKFSGSTVASDSDFAKEPNIKKMDAVDLQNFYNRGKGRSHFFKRNFAFDSLLNALDKGVKGIKSIAPVLTPIAKAGGKMLPLVGAYSSYSEAREAGLPKSAALAYTAAEEANPLPFSGIDWVKAMDSQAKEKAESMRKRYRTDEQRVEEESLENYQNSPAAKDKAYATLRKLLNGYMLDENVPKKKWD